MRRFFESAMMFFSSLKSFIFKTLKWSLITLLVLAIAAAFAAAGIWLHIWFFNPKGFAPGDTVKSVRGTVADFIKPTSEKPDTGFEEARLSLSQWLKPKDVSTKKANSIYSAFARGRVDVDGGIVKLSANKDGVVEKIFAEEGDKVTKGQILARQEDRKERLNFDLQKAQADLAVKKVLPIRIQLQASKRELKRQYNLIKNEVISSKEWDEANDTVSKLEANLEVAEAEAKVALSQQKQAEYEMELKTLKAPADGKILRCDARPGYGVSTLNVTTLFLFIPDNPFIVRAEIEEKFINSIKPGTVCDIIPDTDENKVIKGKVAKIGNYLGPKRQFLDEPQERSDVRTTECIIEVKDKNLMLGQRVLVKFRNDGVK